MKNQNNSDKQERKEGGRKEEKKEEGKEGWREVVAFSCKIRERQPRTGEVTPGDIQAPVFHSNTLPVISMLNVTSWFKTVAKSLAIISQLLVLQSRNKGRAKGFLLSQLLLSTFPRAP